MKTPHTLSARRTCRGVGIVTAIFLLVTLAMLGAFMLSFSNTQHLTSAQDIQGTRAYRAARAGIEWTLPQIKASGTCPAGGPGTVEGFAITLTCSSTAYTEGSTTRTIFRIESVASAGGSVGGTGYVERKISAFAEF